MLNDEQRSRTITNACRYATMFIGIIVAGSVLALRLGVRMCWHRDSMPQHSLDCAGCCYEQRFSLCLRNRRNRQHGRQADRVEGRGRTDAPRTASVDPHVVGPGTMLPTGVYMRLGVKFPDRTPLVRRSLQTRRATAGSYASNGAKRCSISAASSALTVVAPSVKSPLASALLRCCKSRIRSSTLPATMSL